MILQEMGCSLMRMALFSFSFAIICLFCTKKNITGTILDANPGKGKISAT
jgi:hypothetical protein